MTRISKFTAVAVGLSLLLAGIGGVATAQDTAPTTGVAETSTADAGAAYVAYNVDDGDYRGAAVGAVGATTGAITAYSASSLGGGAGAAAGIGGSTVGAPVIVAGGVVLAL